MLAPDGVCERCKGGRIHNVVINRCINGSAAMSLVIMLEAAVHTILGSYRRHVDSFIVPSRFYIDKFAEWGWPRSLFRYVPNFIDVAQYEPRYAAGDRFVYFGRIIRQKGVATLIRAAAEARTPLLIAGTGPDMNAMQALAAQLQADVVFAGHLRGQALHAVIREARGIVLPSEWYENAPVSLLEAYALGKPVIGARIGGIPELVRENETGITYASGDVAALVAALRDFAGRDPSTLADMGRCGRRWVEQEFTLQTYRQSIIGVYGELGVNMTQSRAFALEASS
jgi:glycosyltransferase involved in cell wall biosynthesis